MTAVDRNSPYWTLPGRYQQYTLQIQGDYLVAEVVHITGKDPSGEIEGITDGRYLVPLENLERALFMAAVSPEEAQKVWEKEAGLTGGHKADVPTTPPVPRVSKHV
jgi:hypothetical protein